MQKLGKMTERNMTAIKDVTKSAGDPVLRQQAELLKQGYSPESAGIVRENATPEERAADIADFQRRSREAAQDAVRAGDQYASQEMDRLAGETRKANDALQAARESGNCEAMAAAKKNVVSAESDLVNYQEAQAVAHQSAVRNDTGAAKVIDNARGIDTAEKTPSQLREDAVAPEQKALSQAGRECPGFRGFIHADGRGSRDSRKRRRSLKFLLASERAS